MASNLTDVEEPFLRRTRFLITERYMKYSQAFHAVLARERFQVIRLPPRSPNLNSLCGTIRLLHQEECTGRMIFFGRSSLERALAQYIGHYHQESKQGWKNGWCEVESKASAGTTVQSSAHQRLGGMLSFYYRQAA